MDTQSFRENPHCDQDEYAQLQAIDRLSSHVDDNRVFDDLCAVALCTLNPKVRNKIIKILEAQADKACHRFAQVAADTTCENTYLWALVNLSLLNCRTTESKSVICNGLNHPKFKIQKAAALSIGLFDDAAFLLEVERFMERNRLLFAKDGVRVMASKIADLLNIFKAPRRRENRLKNSRVCNQNYSEG